jgi:hypothetical protein
MLINKIITGFVIQTFDTEAKRFIRQEFLPSDQVEYESETGNPLDRHACEVDGSEPDCPLLMEQPKAS